ncbi:hypothetical protein LWI28_024920 [Acer negundo]|uniref:Aconitase/3-isopropylmalate dehydratase large subunit alpha/beta/alpha domain-containing protein n=1 Tax=Acer negundo TaxID=4023 RepID=A0AAD5NKK9_ACENE|nr:hypothetical protein LWI28_024920 [Acer negundo]
MVLPRVVGFKLFGKLGNGVITIDLVLTVTQMLRKHSVVGKFVEFYAPPPNADQQPPLQRSDSRWKSLGGTCGCSRCSPRNPWKLKQFSLSRKMNRGLCHQSQTLSL